MTRTERLLRLARQRGDRAAELIVDAVLHGYCNGCDHELRDHGRTVCWVSECECSGPKWTEAELRAAWGDK